MMMTCNTRVTTLSVNMHCAETSMACGWLCVAQKEKEKEEKGRKRKNKKNRKIRKNRKNRKNSIVYSSHARQVSTRFDCSCVVR